MTLLNNSRSVLNSQKNKLHTFINIIGAFGIKPRTGISPIIEKYGVNKLLITHFLTGYKNKYNKLFIL